MDTASIPARPGGGEGRITKIPSFSRSGVVHWVNPAMTACSCEAFGFTRGICKHVRIARVRAARLAGGHFGQVA